MKAKTIQKSSKLHFIMFQTFCFCKQTLKELTHLEKKL